MSTSPPLPTEPGQAAEELRELRLRFRLQRELRDVVSLDRLLHVALRCLVSHLGASDGIALARGRGGDLRIVHRLGARQWDHELARQILETGRVTVPADMLYLPLYERRKRVAVVLLGRGAAFGPAELAALRRCGTSLDERMDALAESRVIEVLSRIERKIASELRTADLLYQILDGLQLLVRYDHSASILLLDPERSGLVVRAEKVVWRKLKSPHVQLELAVDQGIVDILRVANRAFLLDGGDGSARVTVHPLFESGAGEPPQVPQSPLGALYDLLCYSCRSGIGPPESRMLVVPLLFGERLLGILKLAARTANALTPEDATVVGRFVEKMSTAIRNADLYERRLKELRAINEIGQLVTQALPLEQTARRILEIVLGVMKLPVGSIELLDRDRVRLRKLASVGYTIQHAGLDVGHGITGEVARTGVPILCNDVSTHPKYVLHSDRTRSELAVPIRFEGTTRGVLNVESYTCNRFRERDVEFLSILADKTAIALETLEQRERQHATLQLLYELGARLAVPENTPRLLQLTVDLTRKHLSCEAASIFLFEDGRYRRRATSGPPPEWFAEESFSTGEGLTGRAAVLRPEPYPQPVVHNALDPGGVPSADGEPAREPAGGGPLGTHAQAFEDALQRYREVLPSGRLAHFIAVPLLENQRPIGILRVLNRLTPEGGLAPSGFGRSDLLLLSTIASQVSLAVADARKRERIQSMSARLEEQVRSRTDEAQRLATFVENAPLAIFWIDADGCLRFINAAGERLFGYQAEELQGRRVDAAGSGILGDFESLVPVVGFMGCWNGELDCRRSDGSTFPVALSACTVADARGGRRGTVVFAQDLTATKELERQLLQSEGKRAMADLASSVAHDVNNALGASLPMIQALADDLELAGDRDTAGVLGPAGGGTGIRSDRAQFLQDLRQIESYTRIAVRIFQGMLSMARGTFAIDQVVDLNARVETALALVGFKLAKGAGVAAQRELADGLPAILANPGRLEQAFHNLITNAVDAMPEGGRLTVRTWCEGDRVLAEVEDTGTGIPEELLARVQEPFYTSKRHGTGLGLSVVRSIAWEHNGKLSLRSQVGVGTTARLEFPALRDERATYGEGERARKEPRPPRGRAREPVGEEHR